MRSILARLSGRPRASVKIRPEFDYVFLSGHGEEARGEYLRGRLVLTVANGESVKGVQLKMTRTITLGHCRDSAKRKQREIALHEWDPFLVQGQPVRSPMYSTTYEWPFELLIPGDWKETFKGCRLCSVAYRLVASTLPDGTNNDIRSFTPIRIIRCPPLSSYELMDPVTTHGKWDRKAEYSISIRHGAIALGGLIPVDAQLATLEPGVQVTHARFFLRESHIVHEKCATDVVSLYEQRMVQEWRLVMGDKDGEMHSWQQCLHLSRVVSSCSPDFDICGITISHTLHFAAILRKDGIDLEFETSIPITLFVSPELPIGGWDMFMYDHGNVTRESLDALAEGIRVPPRYCKGDYCVGDYGAIPDMPPPAYQEC